MRALLAVASLILLAGCFSTGSDPTLTAPSSSSAATSASPAPLPSSPHLTDTLHLLAPPTLSVAAPSAVTDTRVPLQSPTTNGGASSLTHWDLTLPGDLGVLVVNATLWVDVEGTVLGDPSAGLNGCFWNADIYLDGAAPATGPLAHGCVTEPLQVPNGVRPLALQVSSAQGPFAKGTTLHVYLSSSASAAAPGATIDLLTGSAAHDSTLTVKGLQLTVPDLTSAVAAQGTT